MAINRPNPTLARGGTRGTPSLCWTIDPEDPSRALKPIHRACEMTGHGYRRTPYAPYALLDRQEVSLRVPPELLAELSKASQATMFSAAHYVSTLLEQAVLSPLPSDAMEQLDARLVPGAPKAHATLRLSSSLTADVKRAASQARCSVNKYVTWVLVDHFYEPKRPARSTSRTKRKP